MSRGINRPVRVAAAMPEPGELVRAERVARALVLTLDHPPVNVLSRAVLDALAERLDAAEQDEAIRAVVLTSAAEKAFAAGANIREMAPMGSEEAFVHGGRGQAITRRIERLPLPVIAAVHGVCLGGGCEVALACDFIIASEDAQFGQPEINLGVMPGWGGTRRLPRRIGAARARRWILTGRSVSAAEAHAAGLVDQVVARGELLPRSLTLAEELASKPPLAIAAAKYALLNSIDPGIEAGLAYELELWARLFGTEGQREGMQAFLEKRSAPERARTQWAAQSRGFPWSPDAANRAPGGKRNKREVSGRS
jgi:enoyl-CoA hydratase/carnithine racemase